MFVKAEKSLNYEQNHLQPHLDLSIFTARIKMAPLRFRVFLYVQFSFLQNFKLQVISKYKQTKHLEDFKMDAEW